MNAYTISHVNSFYFQGKNVLFHCIDWNVDVRVFEAILDKCSASVITQKTPVCVNSSFFLLKAYDGLAFLCRFFVKNLVFGLKAKYELSRWSSS